MSGESSEHVVTSLEDALAGIPNIPIKDITNIDPVLEAGTEAAIAVLNDVSASLTNDKRFIEEIR